MGWEEIMTNKMPTSALIHSWKGINEGVPAGQSLINAAKKGYKTVLSNGYYIDLMQPISEHYLIDPLPENNNLSDTEKALILGGEATMWSELVTPLTIDSRLWPRTAAIAERFWSDKTINDISSMYKRIESVSFRMEELGITHIRNRDVILRNITNNQNIESLITLSKVSEPLKIYKRNAGGTEYKTFSPFVLFADACTVDAVDSFKFNTALNNFITEKNRNNKQVLISYFKTWITGFKTYEALDENPILSSIEPLYHNLSEISVLFKDVLNRSELSKEQLKNLNSLLVKLENPVVDVELAVYNDFIKLSNYLVEEMTTKITKEKRSLKQ